jgi:DNA modification methylase
MNLQLSVHDLQVAPSTVVIIVGDALECLRKRPAGSVQTVVTSIPYYGARDFNVAPSVFGGDPACRHRWPKTAVPRKAAASTKRSAPARAPRLSSFCRRCNAWLGCFGLEPTYQLYIDHTVEIFREVWRVLRVDGTLWLNMGDGHVTRRAGWSAARYKDDGFDHRFVDKPFDTIGLGLKEKDLMGMPWRVALALQAAGWYLRQNIVWHKKNPMPETVYDRPTTAHEFIFLLAKSGDTLLWRHRDSGQWVGCKPQPDWRWRNRESREVTAKPQTSKKWFQFNLWRGFDYYYDFEAIMEPTSPDSHARAARIPPPAGWDDTAGHHGSVHRQGRRQSSKTQARDDQGLRSSARMGRAPGWRNRDLGSAPPRKNNTSFDSALKLGDYGDGHAGTPKQNEKFYATIGTGAQLPKRNKRSVWSIGSQPFKDAHFATFPPALIEPCILAGCPVGGVVLDPFAGAGTTGLVAALNGRNAILIEKNRDYAAIAQKRIAEHGGGCLVRLVKDAADDFGLTPAATPERADG